MKNILSNRLVSGCIGILFVIALISIVGPMVSPYSIDTVSFDQNFIAPTLDAGRLFGTDDLGRDLFVRTLKGTQVTFLVAIVATAVSLFITT